MWFIPSFKASFVHLIFLINWNGVDPLAPIDQKFWIILKLLASLVHTISYLKGLFLFYLSCIDLRSGLWFDLVVGRCMILALGNNKLSLELDKARSRHCLMWFRSNLLFLQVWLIPLNPRSIHPVFTIKEDKKKYLLANAKLGPPNFSLELHTSFRSPNNSQG